MPFVSPTTHPTALEPAPLRVYFDGSCPLCRREIAYYQQCPGGDRLSWVDVSAPADLGPGLSCTAAMARFHVRDAAGQLFEGGAAFARLWRELPGWRWLGQLFGRPPMRWALELAYRVFLPLRPRLQRWVSRRLGGV